MKRLFILVILAFGFYQWYVKTPSALDVVLQVPVTVTGGERSGIRIIEGQGGPTFDVNMLAEQNELEDAVITALSRWNLPVSRAQLTHLRVHFNAVAEANRTTNLTRITEPVEAAVKHYADSLAPLLWLLMYQMLLSVQHFPCYISG